MSSLFCKQRRHKDDEKRRAQEVFLLNIFIHNNRNHLTICRDVLQV